MDFNEKQIKEQEYTNYINQHVLNVSVAYNKFSDILCRKLDISPYKLGIQVFNHDKSKYSDEEFDGYRQWFYPCTTEVRNKELFDKAWEHHYKNNSHHPEYYLDADGDPLDMEIIDIAEMLLDWEAMSMKFGGSTYDYYMKNRDNKPLSEYTKGVIDNVIDIFK